MPPAPLKTAAVFASLMALAIASRLIPHPELPNVSAVAGVALFAGFFFRSRLLALFAPLAAMLITDTFKGGYHPAVMAVVYGSLIAPVFLGRLLGSARRSPHLLFGATAASLSASLLFFLATNLAVWTFSGYYPTTPAGLLACFAAALPFFRFTLAGDLVSTAFLFASFLLLTRAFGVRSPASRPALLTPAVA